MSRTYFKNDLYNFVTHINNNKNREQFAESQQKLYNQKNKKKQTKTKVENKPLLNNTQIVQQAHLLDEEDLNVAELLMDFKKKQNQKKKANLIYKPTIISSQKQQSSSTNKQISEKQTKDNEKIKAIQHRKLLLEFKMLKKSAPKNELIKSINQQNKQLQQIKTKILQDSTRTMTMQQTQPKQSTNKQQQNINQQKQQEKQQSKQLSKKQQSSQQIDIKKTKKSKMIKKQNNYVGLNLKRRYKDRFVGGINANLRKFNRNGTLKFKYRSQQKQLTYEDGQFYNTYTSSLSAALCMTIDLQQQSYSQQYSPIKSQPPPSPTQWSKQALTKYLQQAFGYQSFRQGQYETLCKILKNQSILFVSQTASGKSLTYVMSSMILGGLSIVVSPLVSLMLDQLSHLPPYFPAACISSLLTYKQRDRIINLVKNNKINLLFITPQSLQSDFIYHLQQFPQVNFVCVDEAHSLSQLSHNFRTSFLGLGQIIRTVIKYLNKKPTILALTATANPQTIQSIKQRLGIDHHITSSHSMNKNLFVTISREGGQRKYQSLINYLQIPQIMKCRGILVYTRTRKIMNQVFNYITNSTSITTAIFHGALPNKQKTQTLSKFRQGEIKIVIATVALGMGLDFQNLQCVIHINMPRSIQNYVQQIGRAGRRQNRAYCHLFLDQNDYLTERNYIIADQLNQQTLSLLYDNLYTQSYARYNKIRQQEPSQQQKDMIAIKRATIMIQHREIDIIDEEEEDDSQQNPIQCKQNLAYSKLYSIKVQKLTQSTQLREQALLTLLLKIQNMMKNQQVKLKVLPVSSQLLKLGFFKKNTQQQLVKYDSFFANLIKDCKQVKGTIYINLIQKCNKMKLTPLQLLTQLYKLSYLHTIKIQLQNPIFVWRYQTKISKQAPQIQNLTKQGFAIMQRQQNLNKVVTQINKIQNISLKKLNILYSVAFFNSNMNMKFIIDKKIIIPSNVPIKNNTITNTFDQYLRSQLEQFYNKIKQNNDDLCVPTTQIKTDQIKQMYDIVCLFFKNELQVKELIGKQQINRQRNRLIQIYKNGQSLTKILMGINSGQVSYKIYGDRSYWMKYRNKNYKQLLNLVRQLISQYAQNHKEIQDHKEMSESKNKQ